MSTPGFGRKVLAPQNRVRIITGRVSAASAIVAGTGFTVSDTATGVDTITFDDKPTAVLMAVAQTEDTSPAAEAATMDMASAPTSIIKRNTADEPYSFIAVLQY